MTKGVLLFAQNNKSVDYVKLASFAASRVVKYLNVPVSIVTNDQVTSDIFDKVIPVSDDAGYYTKYFYDGTEKQKLSWKNTTRVQCYDITPYDETLVLDVDYILNSSTLSYCWNQPRDFLIYQSSFDLAQWRNQTEFDFVSEYSIPFYWATVFWFKKTPVTESFFNIVADIKSNWEYYKAIYQIHSTNFRNDYAFSIALHMMNGFVTDSFSGHLPGKMFYTLDQDILTSIDNTSMQFLVQKKNDPSNYIPVKTKGVDVHVMNKMSLLRCING